MASTQTFWQVPANPGDADLWVCMSCLGEVYWRKVPRPDCPSCHGVSTYEHFTLAAVQDWGTADLIAKATAAASGATSTVSAAGPA
ncbi:MAG: hypothetical protein U0172_13170 [Nitrospiraceae bacterium]